MKKKQVVKRVPVATIPELLAEFFMKHERGERITLSKIAEELNKIRVKKNLPEKDQDIYPKEVKKLIPAVRKILEKEYNEEVWLLRGKLSGYCRADDIQLNRHMIRTHNMAFEYNKRANEVMGVVKHRKTQKLLGVAMRQELQIFEKVNSMYSNRTRALQEMVKNIMTVTNTATEKEAPKLLELQTA